MPHADRTETLLVRRGAVLLALLMLGCAPARIRTEALRADEAAVRAERARSNAAIGAHDVDGVIRSMMVDIVVTGGNGGHLVGRDTVHAVFATSFADTSFLGYVRTTTEVEIGATAAGVAAEHGRWTGRWRAADGTRTLRGSYLAMWRRTDEGWKLRSELYVTIACEGSATCR